MRNNRLESEIGLMKFRWFDKLPQTAHIAACFNINSHLNSTSLHLSMMSNKVERWRRKKIWWKRKILFHVVRDSPEKSVVIFYYFVKKNFLLFPKKILFLILVLIFFSMWLYHATCHIPTAFSLTSRFWSKSKKFWNSKPKSNDKSSNNAKITLATHQNHNLTLPKTFSLHLMLSHRLPQQCSHIRNRLHPLIHPHTMHPHLQSIIRLQPIPIPDSPSNEPLYLYLTKWTLVFLDLVCVLRVFEGFPDKSNHWLHRHPQRLSNQDE